MQPKSLEKVENGVRLDPFQKNSPNGPLDLTMYDTMYLPY